ncbi:protoporphyrinogen oxidase [Coprinopsis cinerea okayama7|uniref:Protoporphyrinogen oxidase n=1 Tax=Coprinopsis cinerea (strain Okayama-7 / 130 / ATCC MYA-4618 / FGSC 9003) TaxID=240176 RepID=A8NR09_COPC7|nr:protoporphyrinogen oxidase [Coprinopsis cinerea okayama7\|eukprot:XP_001835595.1 protoporphyrinogen oxidase [Coprinopsis cinerea okayama7\
MKHVAVLGAGLSGLSSAFHLSRLHPNVRITVLESQKRAGGWVRSTRVSLPENYGSVLLEAGPRTLRPNAQSVLELVNLLGLKEQLITVPKTSPAAKSRYLYIPPDHGTSYSGLQQIPSSFFSFVKSPLSSTLVAAVAQEALKLNNRAKGVEDESVDSFLRRRFGSRFAETFGSAIIHGIYAADSRNISVRAALPSMWDAEARGWGSLVRGMFMSVKKPQGQAYDAGNVPQLMDGVSVYSFRDGMETLTRALDSHIRMRPNVQISYNAPVTSLASTEDGFAITVEGGRTVEASHVVSALPTPILHSILSPTLATTEVNKVGSLTANSTSSVHVVNIVFPGPPCSIHPAGFGYLIPRPPTGYPSTSPEPTNLGILGTVFDSCSLADQDTEARNPHAYHTAKFTKLTVMIGGPYPLPQLPPYLSSTEVPQGVDRKTNSLPQYMQTVLEQLAAHLGHWLPTPLYWRIVPNENCIPTLSPGHLERVDELQGYLDERLGGRLQVVGAGIGGVSLGDCVEAGRTVARRLHFQ